MRRLCCLLAISLIGAFPLSAWADFTVVRTADGTEFKFGLREKFVVFTLNDLDLVDNFNFRSFTSPDRALGEQGVAAQNFANLLFTVERGPLSIHANLEMEAGADAAATDINNINLERIALRYKIPTWGTLTAGLEVRAFDPEGALIYTDEHPGLWLIGGTDQLSWDIGWHRVLDCNRGTSLFTNSGVCKAASATDNDTDDQSDIFAFRVNYQLMPGTTISPLFVYYRRRVDQAALREFSCPVGTATCDAAAATTGDKSDQDQFRPGVIVKSTQGPFIFTGEVVGLFGSFDKASGNFLGGTLKADGTKEFDFQSFALFAEVAMDGKAMGLPGWTPYLNFEWHRGDDDPFDDKLSGYVPISNLSAALRKDGFKGQSISSHGPATLGANSEDGWGFDVSARGVGPTIGSIVPDETLGSVGGDATHFNNRGGKAGNAGFFKVSAGAVGKLAPNWDTHFGISAFWYDALDAIAAEAAQNCIARLQFGCTGNPTNAANVRTAIGTLNGAGLSFDERFMGVEINANVGYTINNFRIQPFVSVFFPGDIVDDINNAFLGVNKSETAWTAGVELSASF